MRKFLVLALVMAVSVTLFACGADDTLTREPDNDNANNETENGTQDETLETFTLEALAAFDGRDGNKGYIAVDGYVYDVSNSSQWPNGLHRNQHQAGQDLTAVINSSPHGRSVLNNIPRIGVLVDGDE